MPDYFIFMSKINKMIISMYTNFYGSVISAKPV